MMSELTATDTLRPYASLAILMVAFSAVRNWLRFLYSTKTSLATPAVVKEQEENIHRSGKKNINLM